MHKKIYIHGSFMNDNYGDFLLYFVSANTAMHVRNDIEVISSDVSKTYDSYIKVNRKNKLKSILGCNAAILSGGGYFSEPPTRKLYWNIRFLIKHGIPLLILSLRKVPYAILGVGAGPISYGITKKVTKKIFNNAKVVSVRDEESKVFLEGIGVNKDIKVIPDWVMGMRKEELVSEQEEVNKIIKKFKNNRIIYVHLTTKKDDRNSGLQIVIDDLVKYCKEDNNTRFIIGCDQKRESQEQRAKEIVCEFPEDRVEFFPYKGPWKLSSMLNSVDAVVTDKLHVGIVATRLGKYVVSVPYHTKTLRFYNQLNVSERSKMLRDIKKNEVYKLLISKKYEQVKSLDSIIELSRHNYSLLEEFIKSI